MDFIFVDLSQTEGKPKQKTKAIWRFFTFAGGCLIKTDPFLQDCLHHY